jgi:hypothetical protein
MSMRCVLLNPKLEIKRPLGAISGQKEGLGHKKTELDVIFAGPSASRKVKLTEIKGKIIVGLMDRR